METASRRAMTVTEKILARAAGLDQVSPGDIVWARVDGAMLDDILGPRVTIAQKLDELGASIWDPDKVTVVSDHYTPPANAKQADIVKFTRDWASGCGIDHYYEFDGPCHQVMVEKARISPGQVIVGTDSHTCMYGALGAFATGIGSTEMLGVLATGEIWLKVPKTIRVRVENALPEMVMAKDVILSTIGQIGHDGATYMAMEFCGTTFDQMIMDERLCVTNMAVEAGAKNGIIVCDQITDQYLASVGASAGQRFYSDPEAHYERTLDIDAARLEPLCACPHEVDNVTAISNVAGQPVDQVYIGGCTGGRYHDLEQAAAILEGRRVAPGVRLLVSPASRLTWERCARDGILTRLADAGAVVLASSCGACVGLHSGVIGAGETGVSTTNRNFIGRMGSVAGQTYLASPAWAAASAIRGVLADPRCLS